MSSSMKLPLHVGLATAPAVPSGPDWRCLVFIRSCGLHWAQF